MARRLGLLSLVTAIAFVGVTAPGLQHSVVAQDREMDANGEAQAKEALRLYKQGLYDDAAKIFAKLSVDYPDMLVFERNLGACFYYLRKPEPAISNLRHYLSRRNDIAPDDKEVVERWIAEMEKLRAQEPAAKLPPPATAAQPTPVPVAAPVPAPEPAWEQRPQPSPGGTPLLYPAPASAVQPSPAQAVQLSPPAPTQAVAPSAPAPTPAALDLSHPSEAQDRGPPFYATWWFWTGAVAVVGGAVTAYLVATHRGTDNACSGGSIPCDAIK